MKKFLELSSWSAAIGFMLIVAFAVVGCDDGSPSAAGPNDEPGVESSSSSVIASETKQSNSSSSVNPISSSSLQGDKKSSSSGEKETSSSSVTSAGSATLSSSSAGALNCSALLEGKRGWSWDVPKECRLNPEISYGTMTDSRDGKKYKTVTIGDQVWMAENLNYADSVTTTSQKGKSWCYNNVAKNCDVGGRLYTWGAAIDSVKLANDADNPLDCGSGKTCGLTGKVQGICPSGWHLPSQSEWNALFTAVGGSSTAGRKLKSTNGWYNSGNGLDAFGFSALPAGNRDCYGNFSVDGNFANFWSSSEYDGDYAYYMYLNFDSVRAYLGNDYKKHDGFSVRCVKD